MKIISALVLCLLTGCAAVPAPPAAPPKSPVVLSEDMLVKLNTGINTSCMKNHDGEVIRTGFCSCVARETVSKVRLLGIETMGELRRRHSEIKPGVGDAAICFKEALESYVSE